MSAICTRTNTRSEACCCGACARGATPDAKRSANKRDALALLDLLAGCIENHPREQERAAWGNVGDAAHLREKLLELAVGFALGLDGSEADARRRIEDALCERDEHVGEALIDAMRGETRTRVRVAGPTPTQPDEPGHNEETTMSKKTTKKQQPEKKITQSAATKAKTARAEPKKTAAKTKAAPTAAPDENAATQVAPSAAPQETDSRLPAPGTHLIKRDRHGAVRCECTVEEGGIRYDGTVYKSLSAAAMAAAKDLGLTNKTQNGFVFWGLSKPRRASNPLEAIERSWTRYHDQVSTLLKGGVTDDNRVEVAATIAEHLQAFESLRERVA